jgi:antitoxin (DNA-binding transcriptional repressor) of toxin-antitoxin stability system
MTTMSAREFNQDVSAAKRAAGQEPVIITDRGTPAYVLMSIDEFRRLTGQDRGIVDWLSADDEIDVESEPLALKLAIPQL